MKGLEITLDQIQARNVAADCATLGTRIEAYRTREPSAHPTLVVGSQPDTDVASDNTIPEVAASEFSVATLRSALASHGALLVKNFISQQSVETLIKAADRVIDACEKPDAAQSGTHFFDPPGNLGTIMPNREKELRNTRGFHRDSGSAMCVEAPSVAETLLQLYEAYGLKALLSEYFGEPPIVSAKKWVLRRSKLPVAEAGWHQDGAFMGTNLNSVNMWIPLNECGGETGAPGLDIIPRRLTEIASAEGAQFDWSVSDSLASNFSGCKPVMPVFEAGDAFFFDHFYLHRTQYRTDFTKLRYAIETWFFGASSFPKNQIPLKW